MKIRNKLIIVLFTVAIVPLLVSNIIFYHFEKQNIVRDTLNHLESVASIQQGRIQSIYQQNLERLRLVSSRTQLRLSLEQFNSDGKKVDQDKISKIIFDAKSSIADFQKISVYNAEGSLVVSTDKNSLKNIALNDEAFKRGLENNQANIFLYDSNQNQLIQLSGPLYIKDRLLGVLIIESSIDNLLSSIRNHTGLGETGETILAKKNLQGDAVFLQPLRFDVNASLKLIIRKDKTNHAVLGEEIRSTEMIDYRNVDVLSVTRFIDDADWGLVVKIDKAEVLATLKKIVGIQITIFTILSVVLIAISIWLSKKITSPLVRMTKATELIVKGDLQIKIDDGSEDELGNLGNAFNSMAASLLQMRNQLESKVAELQETTVLLGNVINSTPDLIFVKDTRLLTMLCNKAYAGALGKTPEEIIGLSDIDNGWDAEFVYGNPDKGIRGFEQDDKEVLAGRTIRNPYDPANIDGEVRIFDTHKTPLLNDKGEIIGVLGIARDTTDRIHAEKTIAQQQQQQQQILDSMVDSVITIDEKENILTFNHAAEILFGFSQQEAIGENVSILMPEPYKTKHDGYMARYMQTGEAHVIGDNRGQEVEGQHKNKKTFPIRLSVAELPTTLTGGRRFIGSCQDLSKIKSQQAQLQRAQKMDALGKLVGGVAHDYNNMLGVILGYTSLINMKYKHVEGLGKYIDYITKAGERGKNLTSRLLDFSKQKSTESQAVNIDVTLKAQNEFLTKVLTAIIEVNYTLCDSLWLTWLDSSEFEDTLLNLTINAKHAMPKGGVLSFITTEISLSPIEAELLGLVANDYIKLSIIDTGCGMDNETISKIFDPFFSTKGDEGTGLGLSQVYGFMERVGGTVSVSSKQGVGTNFHLYFPRYQGDVANNASIQSNFDIVPENSGKILVVDDEPFLRELTEEILSMAGYTVITASDGEDALQLLATEAVELIVSDVIMPKMDGYQLAKKVNKLYPTIKMQLISGFSDDRHIAYPNADLYDSMLYKPFSADELLKRVTELLSNN